MNRIGFQYYPDTLHFQEKYLRLWLPELKKLHATYLVLHSSVDRAIPETFIKALIDNDIEPIIHFPISLDRLPHIDDFELLFSSYARWGIKYIVLFDKPNVRESWNASSWVQEDLVERFLDFFLPLTNLLLQKGLIPVFPPLQPGGDYWDTAFLRAAIQGIQRRGNRLLMENIVFGAYAWKNNHPLQWGVGGPECWPNARPYQTSSGQQDHISFRIFDWYLAIIQAVLLEPRPMILMGVGEDQGIAGASASTISNEDQVKDILSIGQLLNGENVKNQRSIPPQVICGVFWTLANHINEPDQSPAWFNTNGKQLPIIKTLQHWMQKSNQQISNPPQNPQPISKLDPSDKKIFQHYLLLPKYDWGVSDWHLEIIRPFVKKHRPTTGFSMTEASMAERVTVIHDSLVFEPKDYNNLRTAGCIVDKIAGDGTSIATLLSSM